MASMGMYSVTQGSVRQVILACIFDDFFKSKRLAKEILANYTEMCYY
jgi:hypothetical protein